jgi:GMP reductase
MHINTTPKLDFPDVLIEPKRSNIPSRDLPLNRTFNFPHSGQSWTGVPIIASNMDGVGTFSMARVLQEQHMMTAMRKHYDFDDWLENSSHIDWNYVIPSTGTNAIWDPDAADYRLLKQICNTWPVKHICIDVANGYQQNFVDFCKRMRDEFPDTTLMAGNVCTPEITEELILGAGVDVVKIGIGPGSVCTTRIVTGVGMPQLSAIMECADSAHQHKGMIIGDGGCTSSGDIMKAFGGGADFVMLGGMLAFHDESEAVTDGAVSFYGMSSEDARKVHGARKDGYRTAEGKTVTMESRGPVIETVKAILGGIQSGCSYIGAVRLKEVCLRTTFNLVHRTHNRIFGDES